MLYNLYFIQSILIQIEECISPTIILQYNSYYHYVYMIPIRINILPNVEHPDVTFDLFLKDL